MRIQILVDNKDSWYVPYAKNLVTQLEGAFEITVHYRHEEIEEGDMLFLIGCEKKFEALQLNKFNIVIHESELPLGKGWSPLTWQILEGKKKIPITAFEATEKIDAGEIYLRDYINLNGSELLTNIKMNQGQKTNEIILKLINKFPNIVGEKQIGDSTYYLKRSAKDSKINIEESILSQFDLLRVCDNERYPAFFEHLGKKYILKIYEE